MRLVNLPGPKVLAHGHAKNHTRRNLASDYSDRILMVKESVGVSNISAACGADLGSKCLIRSTSRCVLGRDGSPSRACRTKSSPYKSMRRGQTRTGARSSRSPLATILSASSGNGRSRGPWAHRLQAKGRHPQKNRPRRRDQRPRKEARRIHGARQQPHATINARIAGRTSLLLQAGTGTVLS